MGLGHKYQPRNFSTAEIDQAQKRILDSLLHTTDDFSSGKGYAVRNSTGRIEVDFAPGNFSTDHIISRRKRELSIFLKGGPYPTQFLDVHCSSRGAVPVSRIYLDRVGEKLAGARSRLRLVLKEAEEKFLPYKDEIAAFQKWAHEGEDAIRKELSSLVELAAEPSIEWNAAFAASSVIPQGAIEANLHLRNCLEAKAYWLRHAPAKNNEHIKYFLRLRTDCESAASILHTIPGVKEAFLSLIDGGLEGMTSMESHLDCAEGVSVDLTYNSSSRGDIVNPVGLIIDGIEIAVMERIFPLVSALSL